VLCFSEVSSGSDEAEVMEGGVFKRKGSAVTAIMKLMFAVTSYSFKVSLLSTRLFSGRKLLGYADVHLFTSYSDPYCQSTCVSASLSFCRSVFLSSFSKCFFSSSFYQNKMIF